MQPTDIRMQIGKVYSYLRFSDPRQSAGHSAERQSEYARRWADDHGMILDETLTMRDEGLSAYHQRHVKHGALGVFLAAIDAGKIPLGSVLIVESLDRLSRAEAMAAQGQLAQIINADITVVTSSDDKAYNRESLKNNPMDLIYSLLVMIRAHEESETKSKRVRAAMKKLCQRWVEGSYRGRIRNGADPAWARWNGTRFELVPERAEAFRYAIGLFIAGYGNVRIDRALRERGLTLMAKSDTSAYYTVFRREDLVGVRTFRVDGESFRLEGYYPRLIDDETFARLQMAIEQRKKLPRSAGGKGDLPNIFSGLRLLRCGECGATLCMQTFWQKQKSDGSLSDGFRRLRCPGSSANPPKHASFSCAALPLEKAILTYCSSQINLESLIAGNDRVAELRVRKQDVAEHVADLERQLNKILDAALADEGASLPQALLKRAHELEEKVAMAKDRERLIDAELLTASRLGTAVSADLWAEVKARIFEGDYDARVRARQLVADTFESIQVFFSLTKARTPTLDIVLVGRNGTARYFKINRRTGERIGVSEDLDLHEVT